VLFVQALAPLFEILQKHFVLFLDLPLYGSVLLFLLQCGWFTWYDSGGVISATVLISDDCFSMVHIDWVFLLKGNIEVTGQLALFGKHVRATLLLVHVIT
jgi:hypothetical protein